MMVNSRSREENVSHTFTANFVHCVFSTKDRRDLISHDLQPKLWAYLIGTATNLPITMLAIGGTANHVHLLIATPSNMPLAVAVQQLKANSSRWMGEQGLDFEWQKGYGAFSVSPSLLETVRNYIRKQEHHHRTRTFEAEFLALLTKAGIVEDADQVFAA
jgi:REP element-mobilizing transposase RayT